MNADVALFDDRKRSIVPRLGESIREVGHVRTDRGGTLWRYVKGVYRNDGEIYVRNMVRSQLGEDCRRTHFDEVITYLKSYMPTISGEVSTEVLNVANGLLNWRTGVLSPHDPQFISTAQIPVDWNPEATCPNVNQFLIDVAPDKATAEFLVELIGYTLYPGNPYRKAVLLHGPTGTGKSKLLALIKAIVGSENCSAIPLQRFGESNFATAELLGKSANICGDLDARAVRQSDEFKKITGGDPLHAERKYGHPFNFVAYTMLIFSCNELPISSDQTGAYFGRFLIIPMANQIEGTDRDDPKILDKITTRSELEGLLVRAVTALGFLMERGRLEIPAAVSNAGALYRERLDTVAGFIHDECTFNIDTWVSRRQFYTAYKSWCQDTGRMALSAENVYDHLRNEHGEQVKERSRRIGDGAARGFAGIGLVSDRMAA